MQVLGRAVLRALQQPVGAEGVDGQKKDEQMIFKYVLAMKMTQHLLFQIINEIQIVSRMNRLKDEMEAVARELQNNNNMIERYCVV